MATLSPWNDELANWSWAVQLPGGEVEKAHLLTYWSIRLATLLGESIFFVRLPMALAAFTGAILLAGALWKHYSPAAGKLLLVVMTFHSMLHFYSVDANHYGFMFLAGVIALVGMLNWMTSTTIRSRWLWLCGGSLGILLLALAHPFTLFCLGGYWMGAWALGMQEPTFWFGNKAKTGKQKNRFRLIGVLLLLVGLALVAWKTQQVNERLLTQRMEEGVYFSPTLEFLNLLVSNAFGAYLEHTIWDTVTGVLCLIVSFWGMKKIWGHSKQSLGLIVGGIAGFLIPAWFFTMLDSANYFHLKFLMYLMPWWLVMLTIGLMVEKGEAGAGALSLIGKELRRLVLAAFVLRWCVWIVGYSTLDYLPLVPALQHVAKSHPEGAIVATRSNFLAQGYDFLVRRDSRYKNIQVEWLGRHYPNNRTAAARAAWLSLSQPKPVFLLEMKEFDNHLSQGYHSFADSEFLVREFPSFATRDIYPFNRSLSLRLVQNVNYFGQLPVAGAEPIQLYPSLPRVPFYGRAITQMGTDVTLTLGTGATYYLDITSGTQEEVILNVQARQLSPEGLIPQFLMISVQEESEKQQELELEPSSVFLVELTHQKGRFSVPLPISPGKHHVTLGVIPVVTEESRLPKEDGLGLVIRGFQQTVGTEERLVRPLRITRSDDAEERHSISTYLPVMPETAGEAHRVVEVIQGEEEFGYALILCSFRTTGLPSQGIQLYAKPSGNENAKGWGFRLLQQAGTSTSFGPIHTGALIPLGPETQEWQMSVVMERQKVSAPHGLSLIGAQFDFRHHPLMFILPEEVP